MNPDGFDDVVPRGRRHRRRRGGHSGRRLLGRGGGFVGVGGTGSGRHHVSGGVGAEGVVTGVTRTLEDDIDRH